MDANGKTLFASDVYKELKDFPPLVGEPEKDLGKNWNAWRLKLLSFLQNKKVYTKQRIHILWMVIGPAGCQAAKYVYPRSGDQAQDFELLLHDLDVYFIFGSRRKQNNESVDQYIDSLTLLAIASNHNDPVGVVKEKLVRDITRIRFTGRAIPFVQSKGKNLLLYLQQQDLNQIALFWKQYEELMTRTPADNRSSSLTRYTSETFECVRCGSRHARNRCPAYGRQCDKCKEYNHFVQCCRARYVTDCPKCGTSHFQSRCIAHGATCEKCGKMNHFSSFCTGQFLEDCPRCGQDHVATACPAINKICSRCNKPNHFENKCISQSNGIKHTKQSVYNRLFRS
ncbi:uncharacterized protein LOC109858537 isoform X2 [Pseudomyrmex gracilis]|uniref:uncharacterized protein LOC109858537 isoform X2 n=1 Tax=Pseudomyrmex gracilis TaxID=219809 RepID=UPI00099597A8|nr:uncharacterized protein LOC109858537 isoform X2 [Pseudomyrmex gracilis]